MRAAVAQDQAERLAGMLPRMTGQESIHGAGIQALGAITPLDRGVVGQGGRDQLEVEDAPGPDVGLVRQRDPIAQGLQDSEATTRRVGRQSV